MKIRSYDHLFGSNSTALQADFVQVHANLSHSENLLVAGEVLSKDRLTELAETQARTDQVSKLVSADLVLLSNLKRQQKFIKSAYFHLSDRVKLGLPIAPGAEWLLDNNHVVSDHLISLRRQLSRRFYQNLPQIAQGEFKGLPRIYKLAFDYLAHSDGSVDIDYCSSFISSYQRHQILNTGELWALPLMLRLVSIQRLQLLLAINIDIGNQQQLTDAVINRVLADESVGGTELMQRLVTVFSGKEALLKVTALTLIHHLRLRGSQALLSIQWIEQKLKELGVDILGQSLVAQKIQAANQIAIGNSITALNTISACDWKKWFEDNSYVDRILHQDPQKIFSKSDFETRTRCHHTIERLASCCGYSETEVAQKVVAFTNTGLQQLGEKFDKQSTLLYYLIDRGLPFFEESLKYKASVLEQARRLISHYSPTIYFIQITVLTLLLGFGIACWIEFSSVMQWLLVGLLLIPISELGIKITQYLFSLVAQPAVIAKLDFERGIPENCRTAVVVNVVFDSKATIETACNNLAVRYLSNVDSNLQFVLLADFSNASTQTLEQDSDLIKFAVDSITQLNQQYCNDQSIFHVLFRKRVWIECESNFLGWERKRGKLHEFNQLLLGSTSTTFIEPDAVAEQLKNCRYVITLDADTELPPGSARKLVGAIAHPLNQPEFNSDNIVVRGFSVLQPAVKTSLSAAQKTAFSALMAGAEVGLDPYNSRTSEVYQDIFDQSLYLGKGIYDIVNFEKALQSRVPEQSLLSHDLFEGLHSGVGLVTDIYFIDHNPARYNTFSRRQHRWVRGDWQLLPWLFSKVPNINLGAASKIRNPLTLLGRWKIFDNLRRSLVLPSLFFSLFYTAIFLEQSALQVVISIILLIYSWPLLTGIAGLFISFDYRYSWNVYLFTSFHKLYATLRQVLLNLAAFAFDALSNSHAILLTIFRVYITRRHLLEWQTAEQTERNLQQKLIAYLLQFTPTLVVIFILIAPVVHYNPANLIYLLPAVVLWSFAPVLFYWYSNQPAYKSTNLAAVDCEYLSDLAFDTWQFFDQHLTDQDNYLMPDNLQIVPEPLVARRTSPTNIGLSILSIFSAYDLGFISAPKKISLISKICSTLAELDTFRGHLFNWYSTETKQALHPRYVSFVDSGNFIAFLIAAQVALQNTKHKELIPVGVSKRLARLLKSNANVLTKAGIKYETLLRLLKTTQVGYLQISTIVEVLEQTRVVLAELNSYIDKQSLSKRSKIQPFWRQLQKSLEDLSRLSNLFKWYKPWQAVQQLLAQQDDLAVKTQRSLATIQNALLSRKVSMSLLAKLFKRFTTIELSDLAGEHASAEHKNLYNSWQTAYQESDSALTALNGQISQIENYFTQAIAEVDFEFLYDQKKHLFYVGYQVDDARFDNARYDLLASEARLGSLSAIALGKVPQKHWFSMRRAFARSFGSEVLLSWSGTMFEYLMPLLLMNNYPNSLLFHACRSAVNAQMAYARKRNIPWGVSESGYSGVDFHKNYQYKAFGIPGLGLKRGLVDDVVVSPYATGLALLVDPLSAIVNLRKLENYQARGDYGFFEAVDFTPDRLSKEEPYQVVNSFLAHHQGMILVAINNLLNSGIFQKHFHEAACIKAFDSLLHEKFPDKVNLIQPHQAEISSIVRLSEEDRTPKTEAIDTPHTLIPRTRLLSNGAYTVLIDNAGSGHSFVNGDISVNRWKEDACSNDLGFFIYLKDLNSSSIWSATYQPTLVEPDSYTARYHPDRVEFERIDFAIKTHTEIIIDPSQTLEIRKIALTNLSDQQRVIEMTSYAELALAKTAADRAHPAFSKMFVESEFVPDLDALIFKRRPRSDHDRQMFAFHKLTLPIVWSPVSYETSRFEFIGRGNRAQNPKALQQKLTGSCGMVLDPIMSLRTELHLAPGEKVEAYYILGLADSLDKSKELLATYHDLHAIEHAVEMAWSRSHVELRHQLFTIAQTTNFQHLANCIVHNVANVRGPLEAFEASRLSQSGFWRFGISGDLPIVVVRLAEPTHLKLANELLLAHEYLRLRGLNFDLLLLNEYPGGYFQDFQNDLEVLIRTSSIMHSVDRPGGVYLRSRAQLSDEEFNLALAYARVVLEGRRGSLGNQLQLDNTILPSASLGRRGLFSYLTDHEQQENQFVPPPLKGEFNSGYGCFSEQGKIYAMHVSSSNRPPLPWSNVIANPNFGFLVTESGSGYTWSGNSRENRLTAWSNDPVTDPPSEVIYIRDADTGAYWSATPAPVDSQSIFSVKHGFGYSEFSTQIKSIYSKLTISGSNDQAVKWYQLELTNGDYVKRELELYFYVEWVLGINREISYRMQRAFFDRTANHLGAVNYYNNEFAGRTLLIGSNLPIVGYTNDRTEFVGRNRHLGSPLHLESGVLSSLSHLIRAGKTKGDLSNRCQPMQDCCGVIKVLVDLEPHETKSLLFYIAEESDANQIGERSRSYGNQEVLKKSYEQQVFFWEKTTGTIKANTPDSAFNILVNGWLTYQNLSCRLWGRSAFYQSGGAFGFRDQLQDSLALLYFYPELTRQQILIHAERQFVEGDVQHWWHPPTGRGVRTRISDDYLWLPYVVHRYCEVTGDTSVYDEVVPFIEGPALEANQHEIYIVPHLSEHKGSIYEHCIIALDRCLEFGPHGLPLMGGGDWNDGMNEIGLAGKGESVWLGWFIYDILIKFIPLVEQRSDRYRAELYRKKATDLQQALENNAWDGEWYLRAFFDDGSPLGSKTNSECKIDAIAQAWSIISGAARDDRQDQALASAYRELVKPEDGIICLLQPAFDKSRPSPGYIQGYLPGIRENGGQYTHAASWIIMATALKGKGSKAVELFSLINPINHTSNVMRVNKYKGEPYVFCGDVYSGESFPGRAGWSWYTGSAGWLLRVAVEYILGLRINNRILTVKPCVSANWRNFSFDYSYEEHTIRIQVDNSAGVESGVLEFMVNGKINSEQQLDLKTLNKISDKLININIKMGVA